jgi:hypothetical protein
MRCGLLLLSAFLLLPGLPCAAASGPTAPVSVVPAPEGQGEIFSPGVRLVADLAPAYVEEEFFVSGEATVYTYDDPPVRDVILPLDEDVPYTTRIIVRRPVAPDHFNGTLVIEWWNSTAGFDTAPVWDPAAEFFAREGWIYVGVTNSTTSLDFLVGHCRLMGLISLGNCGIRYAALSMIENGQAFEMVSQIANLLKSDSPENPIPPEYEVERIFHAGQSQQGGSMVTYATAFHFPVNDGYFVQAAGTARPINFGPACGEDGSPPYPDCTPTLQGADLLVRTDLPVPVYRAQTETDMGRVISGATRQEDTSTFRYYEMPGTAHVTVHDDVEVLPGLLLDDQCLLPLNTLADGPVFGSYLYNAMWRNMEWQVRYRLRPPHGDLIEVIGDEIARDEFGNALGGIRLPALDVPIATYDPHNVVSPSVPPVLQDLLGLFCVLSGAVTPFEQAALDELYRSHARYVGKVARAADRLVRKRFLLPEDAEKVVREAAQSDIGAIRGNRPRAGPRATALDVAAP